MKKRWIWLVWGVTACAGLGAEGTRPTVSRAEAEVLAQARDVAATNAPAALVLLNDARRDERSSAALDYSAGNLLAGLEAYAEAEEAYRAALEKQADFEEARVGLGRVLAMREAWEEAEAMLRGVARSATAAEDVLLLYGYVLSELGRWISAESVYRRAALAGGESTEAMWGLARCFMAQSRHAEGVALAGELGVRAPDQARVWSLLAEGHLAMEEPGRAKVALEAARRLGVATPAMTLLLGELYVHEGMTETGAEVLRSVVDEPGQDPSVWLRVAGALVAAGGLEDAGRLLAVYREQVPEPGADYFRIRSQWAKQGEREDAYREALADWIRLEPLNEQALLAMGDAEVSAGRRTEAELWYERAMQAHPRQSAPLVRLVRIALDREDYDRAGQLLERAVVLDGDPALERALQQVNRLKAMGAL